MVWSALLHATSSISWCQLWHSIFREEVNMGINVYFECWMRPTWHVWIVKGSRWGKGKCSIMYLLHTRHTVGIKSSFLGASAKKAPGLKMCWYLSYSLEAVPSRHIWSTNEAVVDVACSLPPKLLFLWLSKRLPSVYKITMSYTNFTNKLLYSLINCDVWTTLPSELFTQH